MNKEQALELLVNLAYSAELPKALTGVDASKYLNQINEAKTIIESILKEIKK
tara:strand:- start:1018 stop:1173 length:156 start_codon:yes stop_codon:yes gene_type:complete